MANGSGGAQQTDQNFRWYIVHTYSGFEERVKDGLRQRADALGMGEDFGEIRIPTETVVEFKGGGFGHANQMQAVMLVLCGVYMVLAIRSFIAARKSREAEEAAGAGQPTDIKDAPSDGIDTPDD